MNKKNIIFVQNVEFPQQGAVDMFYYSKFLSNYDNYKLKVICREVHDDIKNNNLELIELGKINYFSFVFKSFFLIKKINRREKVDYTYFFAQHPLSVLLQFFVKYFLGIITIYDVVSGPIGKGFKSKIAYFSIKLGIFISNSYVLDHEKLYNKLRLKNNKNFEIIGIGYDEKNFYPNNNIDLFNKKNDEIIFTYIGSLDKARNLSTFINAFILNLNNYKNIKLYIIGKGNDEYNLKLLFNKYIGKNIYFLGSINHKKIPDYINSSDIMVSYIPQEDYFDYQPPTKLIEYLSCNKPTISTNTYAQREILNGSDYLLHDDSLKATSEKIDYFINNLSSFKNNNYEKIVTPYRWSKLTKKLSNLF